MNLNEIDWGAEVERKTNEDVAVQSIELTLAALKKKDLN